MSYCSCCGRSCRCGVPEPRKFPDALRPDQVTFPIEFVLGTELEVAKIRCINCRWQELPEYQPVQVICSICRGSKVQETIVLVNGQRLPKEYNYKMVLEPDGRRTLQIDERRPV